MSYFTRTESDTSTLNNLAAEIHGISKSKGFWGETPCPDDECRYFTTVRNPGEVLMLIVSEAAEVMESIRDGDPLAELRLGDKGKPLGVPSEMADILIRVLDACAAWGIDIDMAVQAKIAYNATREQLHGRAS